MSILDFLFHRDEEEATPVIDGVATDGYDLPADADEITVEEGDDISAEDDEVEIEEGELG